MSILNYIQESLKLNDNIFYHGSKYKITSFDSASLIRKSGEENFMGEGIYITNDFDVAKSYAYNGYVYVLSLSEPLKSFQYYDDIPLGEISVLAQTMELYDDYNYEYVAEELEYDFLDEEKTDWGKNLIEMFRRNDIDVNDVLINSGYNAIESPINRMNQFRDLSNDIRNICIIKNNIINISKVIEL
jgi:hypothetical protein